jgi:hypothetical protein
VRIPAANGSFTLVPPHMTTPGPQLQGRRHRSVATCSSMAGRAIGRSPSERESDRRARGPERPCNPRRHPILQKAAGGNNLPSGESPPGFRGGVNRSVSMPINKFLYFSDFFAIPVAVTVFDLFRLSRGRVVGGAGLRRLPADWPRDLDAGRICHPSPCLPSRAGVFGAARFSPPGA